MDMKSYPVIVNDEVKKYINPFLVKKQNLSTKDIKKIINLHIQNINLQEKYEKILLDEEKNNIENSNTGKEYDDQWTTIQQNLQINWKFSVNSKMHIFWEVKGCSCPKMDNQDAYPTGFYHYSSNCSIHKHRINPLTSVN